MLHVILPGDQPCLEEHKLDPRVFPPERRGLGSGERGRWKEINCSIPVGLAGTLMIKKYGYCVHWYRASAIQGHRPCAWKPHRVVFVIPFLFFHTRFFGIGWHGGGFESPHDCDLLEERTLKWWGYEGNRTLKYLAIYHKKELVQVTIKFPSDFCNVPGFMWRVQHTVVIQVCEEKVTIFI